ncbi:hypothetical protein ACVIEO_006660 [Rhizobium leguminosarum]
MTSLDRGYSPQAMDDVGVSVADRNRYYTLDAMRGFAAICVVATHFRESYAPSAYLAVDFFFVLSGFIIAEIYGKRLSRGLLFQSFMAARIKRLYPLYLIGILVGLIQIILLTSWGLRNQSVIDLLGVNDCEHVLSAQPNVLPSSEPDARNVSNQRSSMVDVLGTVGEYSLRPVAFSALYPRPLRSCIGLGCIFGFCRF